MCVYVCFVDNSNPTNSQNQSFEKTMTTFVYVLIPCANTSPLEELTASKEGGLEADELQKYAKSRFYFDSSVEDKKALLRSQLKDQGINPDKINPSIMASVEDRDAGGNVEIVSVLLPTPKTQYIGVSMYSDGNAAVKHLPINERATALLQYCGINNVAVLGDAFIGKYYDNEEFPWERRDLCLSDVCDSLTGAISKDSWLCSTAAACNAGKDMSKYTTSGQLQNMLNNSAANNQPLSTSPSAIVWTQTDEEVELSLPVPLGTTTKDIQIKFSRQQLLCRVITWDRVLQSHRIDALTESDESLRTVLLAMQGSTPMPLYDAIQSSECTWTIDKGHTAKISSVDCVYVTLTMTKSMHGLRWLQWNQQST